MRMPLRRALVAATVTALALPSGASAACLPICVGDVPAVVETTFECLPICLDELYRLMDKALEEYEGDSDGTLCAYAKLYDPAPTGWGGGSGGAPYIWVDTEKWGDDNPREWDERQCVYVCEVLVGEGAERPDLSSPPDLSSGGVAACAAPLVPRRS